jgi:hypothetical protein
MNIYLPDIPFLTLWSSISLQKNFHKKCKKDKIKKRVKKKEFP